MRFRWDAWNPNLFTFLLSWIGWCLVRSSIGSSSKIYVFVSWRGSGFHWVGRTLLPKILVSSPPPPPPPPPPPGFSLTLQHDSISFSQTSRASSSDRTEFWYVVSGKMCDQSHESYASGTKRSRGRRQKHTNKQQQRWTTIITANEQREKRRTEQDIW